MAGKPTEMKQLKIAIIGGSNSFLKNGYTKSIPEAFQQEGIDCRILNLAVGANCCLRGLSLIVQADLSGFDAVLIEYFINDHSFYSDCGSEAWMSAYEGILRYILTNYPTVKIVPLVLDRRDRAYAKFRDRKRADLFRMLAHYDLEAADFDARLRAEYPEREQFNQLYIDGVHYRSPHPTEYLARFVAAHILAVLPNSRMARTPPPLSALPFERTRTIKLATLAERTFPLREFRNSKFTMAALAIPAGSQLEMDVTDLPLAIAYLSATQSCDIVFEKNGLSQRFHTLHKRVDTGEFGFLLMSAILLRNDWQSPATSGKVVIKAVRSDEGDDVVRESRLIANKRESEQFLFLTGLTVNEDSRSRSTHMSPTLRALDAKQAVV